MSTETGASLTVATIAPSEADRAIAVISLAFSSDPAARWTYPDAGAYIQYFPSIVRAFGGRALEHGTGHQVSGFQGVALWLPPGVEPDQQTLLAIMQQSLPADRFEEVTSGFERMNSYHPEEPHWYLPMIGVDPLHQGQGCGSALLKHALQQCDQNHVPAYLESSNEANIPLYERHGFVPLGTIQVGSSPQIVPMLRAAR